MAKILFNRKLSGDFFLMKAQCGDIPAAGQFYMLRAWQTYPVLSRPVSVYDCDGEGVTFCYKVVGEGTELFSRLREGDEITLQGPYGTGFPDVGGKIALVGGGAGIAPLFLTAKRRQENGGADVFLGFSGETMLIDEYERVSGSLSVDVGGYITDKVEPERYDFIFACGPEAMMRALYQKCVAQNIADRLYVSLESRMACGFGACLVCSCKTTGGNRRVCKDGPVFKAGEVFAL